METHDPQHILEPIIEESKRVLREMRETEDIAKRKELSQVLKNLCDSAGVFFNFMTDTMLADDFPNMDDFEFEPEED